MKRILIVDDEGKIRNVYLSLLRQEGFEVLEAKDASEANEMLKKQPIDLVLLDIKMPEVDGSILYGFMNLFHKKVKVIVASVYPIYEQKTIIKDAFDYYDKSQGTEALLSKVKRALRYAPVEENTRC